MLQGKEQKIVQEFLYNGSLYEQTNGFKTKFKRKRFKGTHDSYKYSFGHIGRMIRKWFLYGLLFQLLLKLEFEHVKTYLE